ncbi:MAG: PIN domain-containing protein [Myxococcota bacterium]
MILIDTSAWIDFFRGTKPMCDSVDTIIGANEAAVCGPIITELRRGLYRSSQSHTVLSLLEGCHWLEAPKNLWVEAGDIGAFLSKRGTTVKTLDLLIATIAMAHGAAILTSDADFRHMQKDVGLLLVDAG